MTSTPPRGALVALCTLALIGAAFVLGLYGLTDVAARPALLDRLTGIAPVVVVAVPAILAWLRGEQLGKAHRQTAAAVERVEHQTNGQLTARLKASNDALREELLEQLPRQIVAARADDQADAALADPATYAGPGDPLPEWAAR